MALLVPIDAARRYLGMGVREFPGGQDNPHIRAWLFDCGFGPEVHDEVAWCGAFLRHCAWLTGYELPLLPARARSWLTVGSLVPPGEAAPGDVVILMRGGPGQPGAGVLDAPGHVGFFIGRDAAGNLLILAGNQNNQVCVEAFDPARVLGVRRLRESQT